MLGETAQVHRFRSIDAFARLNGTAPRPVWSSSKQRHRLSRTGNRTVWSLRVVVTSPAQGTIVVDRLRQGHLRRCAPGKARVTVKLRWRWYLGCRTCCRGRVDRTAPRRRIRHR
ncbi:transposase [Mycolicibacterium vulneris]|uniref:transposase n=1 Tax=Mycolicibacterium vulneris TaxID=547163 RepID=UPI002481D286|nr:transposase [Mycolicibacterium vulneris]